MLVYMTSVNPTAESDSKHAGPVFTLDRLIALLKEMRIDDDVGKKPVMLAVTVAEDTSEFLQLQPLVRNCVGFCNITKVQNEDINDEDVDDVEAYYLRPLYMSKAVLPEMDAVLICVTPS